MEKINFKKKYGQNFLTDTNLLKAIVADSEVSFNDEVLEIGAGAGALTTHIKDSCKKVVSFEIDKDLEALLKDKFESCTNVHLRFEDVMKVSTQNIDALFDKEYRVIANLPYYITTPILFKFLEESKKLISMTIMVQKEVAEKIIAEPKNSNYGILSVMVQHYTNAKITRIVKKQMFTPQPKVDSAIIVLKRKQVNFDANFKNFVQTAFAMRRKTLVNNLSKLYSKSLIEDVLQLSGYNKNIRAEELSPVELEKLFRNYFDKISP